MPHPFNQHQQKEFDVAAGDVDRELPPDKATLVEVARGLNATVRLIQVLHNEVKQFAIEHATFSLTIASMEETLRDIRKVLTVTEPTSLPIRVVVLEQELAAYKEWKKEFENRERTQEQEKARAGLQFKTSLTISAISFVSAIAITVFGYFLKR